MLFSALLVPWATLPCCKPPPRALLRFLRTQAQDTPETQSPWMPILEWHQPVWSHPQLCFPEPTVLALLRRSTAPTGSTCGPECPGMGQKWDLRGLQGPTLRHLPASCSFSLGTVPPGNLA